MSANGDVSGLFTLTRGSDHLCSAHRCRATFTIGCEFLMLKFLGSTIGIIFLIGLLVVVGVFALIF